MSTVYILAAGKGTKIWPYGERDFRASVPPAQKPRSFGKLVH